MLLLSPLLEMTTNEFGFFSNLTPDTGFVDFGTDSLLFTFLIFLE